VAKKKRAARKKSAGPKPKGPPARWQLTITNDMDRVGDVNRALEEFLLGGGVAAEVVFWAKLACEEAVTNVIKYSFQDDGVHQIVLEAAMEAGELVLRVADDGREFNPLDARPPALDLPIEDRPIGGLGIHLLRQLTRRMEYHRTNGRNVLTLSFSLAIGET